MNASSVFLQQEKGTPPASGEARDLAEELK